jgi:hypothetical protein
LPISFRLDNLIESEKNVHTMWMQNSPHLYATVFFHHVSTAILY